MERYDLRSRGVMFFGVENESHVWKLWWSYTPLNHAPDAARCTISRRFGRAYIMRKRGESVIVRYIYSDGTVDC